MKMMKSNLKLILLTLIIHLTWVQLSGQGRYNDFRSMSQKINKLGTDYSSLCSVKSLVKTAGGKDIWVVTIGTGDKDRKPGIAVVGGIEGSYLLGKELALGFAENLLRESANPEIKNLLNSLTFYVFPDVSPDASEQFFANLKYERTVNARATDDDRDFMTDEDTYEDLNNDGLITFIRITDPTGTFIESEDDRRVLIPADLSKGQTGIYRMYPEGVDNDKDGSFNEDGAGGVNFNKNFSFNYEEFGMNAGLHAISEAETKAVADFLFDHFNIYATFAFGPQDNLGQPMKASERTGAAPATSQAQFQEGMDRGQGGGRGQRMEQGDRRITAITRTDEVINKLVSDRYHEITGIKGAPVTKPTPGNFMEWAYFHYGRYSFGTPGWWLPADRVKNAEATFLKYAKDNKINDAFVPWTEIKHPDFPDKKVEVGGIKPFIMINPPADTLDYLISRNYKFLTAIAALHPELEYLDSKVENAGENIFRVTLKVHNKGVFATCAEAGDFNQWTRIMRITLEPGSGQSFLSGQKVQRIQRLEGDKTAEYSWLISGKGSVKVTAGALNVGTITTTLELK
ncbi:MAG: peptidase [Odoribacter sp.]|nr:peptidase [Odoribacter sp.]